MAVKQFKAESKRILDLMINSIYTHKEIFLREVISNASDALDKLYYLAVSRGDGGVSRDSLGIDIKVDRERRLLIVSDNGTGMTAEELEKNLGTIARSGSLLFKKETGAAQGQAQDGDAANGAENDIDIIGQFGVGFYSVFMVASRVEVRSRAYGAEAACCWISEGAGGYTVEPYEKDAAGTEVILTIKEDTEDDKYGEFLEPYRIRSLIKKYSDYIRYPIRMDVEKSRIKEGSPEDKPEYETYTENETLNSMVPIWKKQRQEVTDEEYAGFYKDRFFDYEAPLRVIRMSAEGASTYSALLFIPARAPYDFFTRDYEKGLMLYSSGVMIMEKCKDLLPEHFRFVRGLVDSQDLSLNISREMLQHDRQLKAIASRIEKKVRSELLSMLENEREKYEEFYMAFGLQLKYGVVNEFGRNAETLSDLLMFCSSESKKLVTLAEYVSRMKEGQNSVYYACGDSPERIEKLPQIELLRDKGFEILYLTDDVDEFTLRTLREAQGKEFKNAAADDIAGEIETPEEKEETQKAEEESRELLTFIKEVLGDRIARAAVSRRLKTHPVCLASDGEISVEMEKVLNAMPTPDEQKVKASKVLELNAGHNAFAALSREFANDKNKASDIVKVLYNQALLIEGLPIEDPVEYSNLVCSLLV